MSIQIPETGFLRLHQIIGNPKADPPVPPIIPIGKSTWWAGVQSGRFPKSVSLGPNTTAWRVKDILDLISRLNSGNESSPDQEDQKQKKPPS